MTGPKGRRWQDAGRPEPGRKQSEDIDMEIVKVIKEAWAKAVNAFIEVIRSWLSKKGSLE